MRLAAATWPEVEAYLKISNALILPIGSTEQHGPTGLIGTDHLCADAVAQAVGERLKTFVAPPLCYGVSSHHMAFPGSATIRPSVYQAVLVELLTGFYQHGFRRFYVVNGHGGNEPSLMAALQELKHDGMDGATFHFYNWWKIPEVARLARELYGDEEGSHATPSEVSLTYHLEGIEKRDYRKLSEPVDMPWPPTAAEMRKVFVDGTMRSNPGLARGSHGEKILKVAADAIAQAITKAPVL